MCCQRHSTYICGKAEEWQFVLEIALLQLFVSLTPALAFVIWYDRPDRQRGMALFVGAASAAAMVLCILLSEEIASGFDMDFRTIPYTIGSMYGGYGIFGLLTLLYIALRVPLINGVWEAAGLFLFLIVFVPGLGLAIRWLSHAGRRSKQRFAFVVQIVFGALFMLSAGVSNEFNASPAAWLGVLVYFIGVGLISWASVFLIEATREKLMLQERLRVMTHDYRNEVQKLQQFIDVTPLGVVLVDGNGIITHMNDQALSDIRGTHAEDRRLSLIGRPYTALADGTGGDADLRLLQAALAGAPPAREIVRDEDRIHLKTGVAVRNMAANRVIGAAVITHDITEVTRLKDEISRVERLSLVGQMAASITHEIRNPMAVIRGFIQLLSERYPDGRQDYYRIIMQEIDRANSIISDFLSLAQNRVVEMSRHNLHDIICDLSPLLWADANMRGLSIELDLCSGMPDLDLNEKEIKQMILNLARNGLEAMEDGALRIATRLREDSVELIFADKGKGIPREMLDRLFEPFYTTKPSGTGLGLPLCLSIAERHNGRITVDSQIGEGTTITVSFRIDPEQSSAVS